MAPELNLDEGRSRPASYPSSASIPIPPRKSQHPYARSETLSTSIGTQSSTPSSPVLSSSTPPSGARRFWEKFKPSSRPSTESPVGRGHDSDVIASPLDKWSSALSDGARSVSSSFSRGSIRGRSVSQEEPDAKLEQTRYVRSMPPEPVSA